MYLKRDLKSAFLGTFGVGEGEREREGRTVKSVIAEREQSSMSSS